MDVRNEKKILSQMWIVIACGLLVMAGGIYLLCTAAAGSTLYYTGCALAVLAAAVLVLNTARSLGKLEKMGLSKAH